MKFIIQYTRILICFFFIRSVFDNVIRIGGIYRICFLGKFEFQSHFILKTIIWYRLILNQYVILK